MPHQELQALIIKARAVLERHLLDAEGAMRDDVAELCMAIDDLLPDETRVRPKRAPLERALLERSAA